jgi:signal transduction histidine kinase
MPVDEVLQGIVDRVRRLVNARYAALGIVDASGSIERFFTSGLTTAEREAIGPPPEGHGLLGLIIRDGRSYRIPDVTVHPDRSGFPPNHPRMQSLLGVPIAVKGRVIGNVYLTDKLDAVEFSEQDQVLVETFALHAGIAIDNARLHEKVQQLAVLEERERIGKDLHDGIIQTIYGVALSLEDLPSLIDEDRARAVARIDQVIDTLNGSIRDIRNFIFGLRPERFEEANLADGLSGLAEEFRVNTTLDIDLHTQDFAGDLPVESRAQLLYVAREALSNAARHADATHVDVRLATDAEGLHLTIADNGRGFDPATAGGPGHFGLANMAQRVESIGGTLRIESGPGSGARVLVRVPVATDPEGAVR